MKGTEREGDKMSFVIGISILLILLVVWSCAVVSNDDLYKGEMNEKNLKSIPESEKKNDTKRHMCSSCNHKKYCIGAYKKDHWCGNYRNM